MRFLQRLSKLSVMIIIGALLGISASYTLANKNSNNMTIHTSPKKHKNFELNFTGPDGPTNLEQFEDKLVILHFWATWCNYCLEEMRALDLLQKDYKKYPLQVIALSQDFQGQEVIKKFYDARNITNLPIYIDNQGSVMNAFGFQGLPSTVILAPGSNRELARKVGEIKWSNPLILRQLDEWLAIKD